jgi:hypothetical protein
MTKTEAAKKTLGEINPDVHIEEFTMNITTVDNFEKFFNIIKAGLYRITCRIFLRRTTTKYTNRSGSGLCR